MKKFLLGITLIFSAFLLVACTNNSFMKTISYEEFGKKLENKDSFVLEIRSDNCRFCKQYEPTLKKVSKDLELTIYSLNTDTLEKEELKEFFDNYGEMGTPTLLFFEDGHEKSQLFRSSGAKDYDETIKVFKNAGYEK